MIAHRVWLVPVTVICLASASVASAQVRQHNKGVPEPVVRVAAATNGSIYGVVLDESGAPVDGVVISALGGAHAFAVTDQAGQYHAHAVARRAPTLCAPIARGSSRSAARSSMCVRLAARRRRSPCDGLTRPKCWPPASAPSTATIGAAPARRERSGVAAAPPEAQRAEGRGRRPSGRRRRRLAADDDWFLEDSLEFLGRAFESSARLATAPLQRWPVLRPVQPAHRHRLSTTRATWSRSASRRAWRSSRSDRPSVGTATGRPRVAMNSGDVSVVDDGRRLHHPRAGASPSGRSGVTYSLQRYEGGNFAALQARARRPSQGGVDFGGPRCRAHAAVGIGYGARYEHYDYLDGYGLVSPSARHSFTPLPALRFHARASRQQIAPGAEEFVPPADAQWVPPQRTFAPIGDARFSTESVAALRSWQRRASCARSVGGRPRLPPGHRRSARHGVRAAPIPPD